MCTSLARKQGRQHGLTMIELVIFIVIIGIAVAGVLGVLSLTTGQSADPLQRKQALLIAEGLLEEVELAHFTFCHPSDANAESAVTAAIGAGSCATTTEAVGPLAGEVRPYYNVNDYAGALNAPASFTAGDATGLITDATGTSHFSGRYTAKVTLTTETVLGPAGMLVPAVALPVNPADTNALHISVNVSYGNNQHIILDGYRTRYAPNAVP